MYQMLSLPLAGQPQAKYTLCALEVSGILAGQVALPATDSKIEAWRLGQVARGASALVSFFKLSQSLRVESLALRGRLLKALEALHAALNLTLTVLSTFLK